MVSFWSRGNGVVKSSRFPVVVGLVGVMVGALILGVTCARARRQTEGLQFTVETVLYYKKHPE